MSGEKIKYKHAHRSLTGRQALTEHVCEKSEALFEGHTKKSQMFFSGKPSGTTVNLGNVSCGKYEPRGFTVPGCLIVGTGCHGRASCGNQTPREFTGLFCTGTSHHRKLSRGNYYSCSSHHGNARESWNGRHPP